MFNLWGDFNNFNYAKQDEIKCSSAPAGIDEWSGRLADYRGLYCPDFSSKQLWKSTWNSNGTTRSKLNWAAASRITRFESGIWGITTDGKLLILWNDAGTIRSAPLELPNINGVRAVGGLEDKFVWDAGVLLTNKNDVVYNVYWSGSWKEREIFIDKRFTGNGKISVFFGSHNGEMYMLYGWFDNSIKKKCDYSLHEVYLYHMKFVGGADRYQAIRIQGVVNPTY